MIHCRYQFVEDEADRSILPWRACARATKTVTCEVQLVHYEFCVGTTAGFQNNNCVNNLCITVTTGATTQGSTCAFGTTATQVGPAPLIVQPNAPASLAADLTALHKDERNLASWWHTFVHPSLTRATWDLFGRIIISVDQLISLSGRDGSLSM